MLFRGVFLMRILEEIETFNENKSEDLEKEVNC